jgi:hypothetical protein
VGTATTFAPSTWRSRATSLGFFLGSRQAREAAEFYTSVFPDSRITDVTVLHDTPSGDCDVVSFELAGQKFMAISAGPHFALNPSVSFFLNFDPSPDQFTLAQGQSVTLQITVTTPEPIAGAWASGFVDLVPTSGQLATQSLPHSLCNLRFWPSTSRRVSSIRGAPKKCWRR